MQHLCCGLHLQQSCSSLTLLQRLVLNAFPLDLAHGPQGANGDVPTSRLAKTCVAGLLPLQVIDRYISTLLHHRNSIVTCIGT